MYKDLYRVPQPKVDIDTPKALTIVATIFLFFVIPSIGISYFQSRMPENASVKQIYSFDSDEDKKETKTEAPKSTTSNSTERKGSVAGSSVDTAGVSTTKDIYFPLVGEITLNNKSGILMIAGFLMVAFSSLVFIYLLVDNKHYHYEELNYKHY